MKMLLCLILTFATSICLAANTGKQATKKRTPASEKFKVHQCEQDAITRAGLLVKLHLADTAPEFTSVDDNVALKSPIKTPAGNGHLDVLEVFASADKANYRMHFIYAQIKGVCVLMGQEILDMTNPY